MTFRLSFLTVAALVACNSPRAAGEAPAEPPASASSTLTVTSALSAAPEPPATAPPPPILHDAKERTTLGTSGLAIRPSFRYTLEPIAGDWRLENKTKYEIVYLMRKYFTAEGAGDDVVPCEKTADGVGKKLAGGAFVYRCKARSAGNGTWFALVVPITDGAYHSLVCAGSSTEAAQLSAIENACRSLLEKT